MDDLGVYGQRLSMTKVSLTCLSLESGFPANNQCERVGTGIERKSGLIFARNPAPGLHDHIVQLRRSVGLGMRSGWEYG